MGYIQLVYKQNRVYVLTRGQSYRSYSRNEVMDEEGKRDIVLYICGTERIV